MGCATTNLVQPVSTCTNDVIIEWIVVNNLFRVYNFVKLFIFYILYLPRAYHADSQRYNLHRSCWGLWANFSSLTLYIFYDNSNRLTQNRCYWRHRIELISKSFFGLTFNKSGVLYNKIYLLVIWSSINSL